MARPRECPAIRRPLWIILVAALIAVPAAAQVTANAWSETWAAPGTPGAVDDVHLGHGMPLAFLGLVAGGVGSRDALLAGQGPWPALTDLQAPLAWYDSTRVRIGADAGWRGYGASIVEQHSDARPVRTSKPRAAFTFVNGGGGVDRNGLLLARGDGSGWLRAGAVAERREAVSKLGLTGRHLWFLDVGQVRGPGTLRVNYTQRGTAGGTVADASEVDLIGGLRPPYPGFEEASRGEAGFATWEWARAGSHARVSVQRSHDHRESFESPVLGVQSLFAEREAQRNAIEFEGSRDHDGRTDAVRLELADEQVRRSPDYFLDGVTPRAWAQRTVWLAARRSQRWAGGTIEGQWGMGWQRADAGVTFAPQLEWRAPIAGTRLRVHGGRHLTPVWSDLAGPERAFTQDVWLVGAEDVWGDRTHRWLELGVLGARIGSPAGLERTPVLDIALRRGWTRLGERAYDGLVTLGGGARRGMFTVDASAFARVRPRVAFEALTEPAVGARWGVTSDFRLFSGDLGVMLRLEGAYMGARECAALPEYSVQPLPVAAMTTWGGSLMLELGDAHFGMRAFDLEDVAHPLIWADPSRSFPGAPAVSAGRQFRFELAWPFFN